MKMNSTLKVALVTALTIIIVWGSIITFIYFDNKPIVMDKTTGCDHIPNMSMTRNCDTQRLYMPNAWENFSP